MTSTFPCPSCGLLLFRDRDEGCGRCGWQQGGASSWPLSRQLARWQSDATDDDLSCEQLRERLARLYSSLGFYAAWVAANAADVEVPVPADADAVRLPDGETKYDQQGWVGGAPFGGDDA